jgi:pyruvate-ferredoxin/flavodoxin oxidoreductase
MTKAEQLIKYPGVRAALDGNSAVIMCEREASDAAGAYPITPSTQMGEYWAEAAAAGHLNIADRPLIFIEPEGEHAAAAVTAGLSMTGLRAINFSSGQGIAYMHESLYAAVGKRLTYILNIGARAITKSTLNVHAGHDDYHCIDDTGFFQLFACDAQQAADLNIISHRIAELSLNPGIVAQDGFLTTHLIESLKIPERELIADYLGRPDDMIDCPTPAQRMLFGPQRRRVPELWDVDNPVMAGLVENQDSYMQSVAAQRPFFFDHIEALADQAFEEFAALTGRRYAPVMPYRCDDADYLIVGQGSLIPSAMAVADYLRETRKLKVGVVAVLMFRPFPGGALSELLRGRKGVAVLERLDQPLAADLPLIREIRTTLAKSLENGKQHKQPPHPKLATYKKLEDLPPLYSGSFGMGSRDLQPEGLIAAVENMLPEGARRSFYYLSIDFLREQALTPKQAVHQQALEADYPQLRELALHGSENPNLMPPDSVTVRFHSIGGWGAITTGKNLAMTLFELLGYHIKANPKYGSEKKGQPTTYYLSAAPEPIRVNCEYFYVDVVLSPDPNVFQHTNALAGLKEGGIFIIQSELESAQEVWESIPEHYQRLIEEKQIRLFYLDAFRIARDEATDVELQLRMQGNAFQGAFFRASPVAENAGLSEEKLLGAIREQLQHKFGAKGARVVEDNVRVVRRGYDELVEVTGFRAGEQAIQVQDLQPEPPLPPMLRQLPQSQAPLSDVHRFWEQTGNFYARGMGNDNLADPFIATGTMPATTALFRDMTGIRFEHPEWIAENCTACGDCYTICPDTAIPGLVSEITPVLDTVLARVRRAGHEVTLLPRALRQLEGKLRPALAAAPSDDNVRLLLRESIAELVKGVSDEDERSTLRSEFDLFEEALGDFQFALSRPYFTLPEKNEPGSGGLLSITINPYTCKGCMECVAVCNDDALRPVTQTPDSIASLRAQWDLWEDLPNTPPRFIRIDDLDEGIGALETLLLDKDAYGALASGDGACLGCSEKTALHLFTATMEALMQPRVKRHVAYLDDLLVRLEQHLQQRLLAGVHVDDSAAMAEVLKDSQGSDLSLADLARRMSNGNSEPIDQGWLRRVSQLIADLKALRGRYTQGTTGRGRASMGMINATGCTSVWGSTYPFNPYPFPWTNHLFQDAPSIALGVFEGHMAKMAQGFAAVRQAELELAGEYREREHGEFFKRFNWEQFSDEEFLLCPPVVAVGGDGAMYDIGFQNLSRALMSGKPVKMLVVDTQVYSNTGGQACTSGFFGQISDMAQYGAAIKGKQEARKEIGLIGMAHRTTYVLQSSTAHANHMIEGFIHGLNSRRPALFNLYTPCQPEHGIGDDMGYQQAKLAVESRAYPLFSYDPDRGRTPAECFNLEGNPSLHDDWPVYKLQHNEGGRERSLELPLTFADFAMSEARFRKHFRMAAPDTWHDDMLPLADYLALDAAGREGKYPFIWSVDKRQRLTRLLVDEPMAHSCEERLEFWVMLKAIAGVEAPQEANDESVEERARRDVVGRIAQGLMQWASGDGEAPLVELGELPPPGDDTAAAGNDAVDNAGGDFVAPWIETEECTACDECININSAMFAYNEAGKAVITDAKAGSYQDLVKAAEKCTAQVIHPGLPGDRSAPDIERWIARGEKYN